MKRTVKRKLVSKKSSVALYLVIAILCTTCLGAFASSLMGNKGSGNGTTVESIEGKYISFLGDSITTYTDWSNNTDYNSTIGSNVASYNSSILPSVTDTWWKKTIDELGMKLCVNNSWGGSHVTTHGGTTSAACMTRAQNLHNDNKNIKPDIIVVYIGINDYRAGVTLGSFESESDIYDSSTRSYTGDLSKFADAYATMVHKMKKAYPEADIYLCNLVNYNEALKAWNTVIKNIAKEFDCNLVDFYNGTGINASNVGSYTIGDKLHPNKLGMTKMYSCIKKSLQNNYD